MVEPFIEIDHSAEAILSGPKDKWALTNENLKNQREVILPAYLEWVKQQNTKDTNPQWWHTL